MKATYDMRNEKYQNSAPNDDGAPKEVSTFRRFLPQIAASTVKNCLLLDLGLSIAFPAIIIPALTGIPNEYNQNELLSLTKEQASWLGSIAFIFQPIGSIVSGWITDPLGRKKAMFLVNIPHVIAWFLMYQATEVWHIFAANVFLGLGVGLMEAPILTYVAEICEKSIRGILIALSSIAATLGLFIVFLLGSLTEWRNVALYCINVPIFTMVAVCFIPETPLWLLSKNREAEALKSLQWLRGWVSAKAVKVEFDEIKRYNEYSVSCNACIKTKQKCTHPSPTFREKLQELLRRRTMKPFIILLTVFAICQFSVTNAMRPYIVQILKSYGSPISPNWASVLLGLTGVVGTLTCVLTVKLIGKRKLYLISLCVVCASALSLSAYGLINLPMGWTSFNRQPDQMNEMIDSNYFPLAMFLLMGFGTAVGVNPVPWMLLSELFPFKSRGFATGMTAAINYVMQFVATKTYYNLETTLGLSGITCLYAMIGIVGWIIMYRILPETEDRSLEDIEMHFSNNSLKLSDHNIPKSFTKKKQNDNPKDCETNVDTTDQQIGKKSITTISDMIETNENANYHNQINITKDGCDNKGFTMDSNR